MSNSNTPITVSLSTARGWKKAERVTNDVAPTKFLSEDVPKRQKEHCSQSDPDTNSTSSTLLLVHKPLNSKEKVQTFDRGNSHCLVCRENEARYTCPRCKIPYCSTACYRNHTNNTGENAAAHSCSEHFFKKKVASLMKLESLEQKEKAHRALNRYHHENQNNNQDEQLQASFGEQGTNDNNVYDLYQLWSQLEALEDSNKELSQMELAKVLPPSLKAMFDKDLRTGQVQADLVLNRWYPWWERELVSNPKEKEISHSNSNVNVNSNVNSSAAPMTDAGNDTTVRNKTLDERLLKVPSFAGLGRKTKATIDGNNKNNNINNNDEALFFNLLDIIYATCRTLRLYHGVENASRQAPVEAATTFIATSSVLHKDTRFTTLSQVLNHHYCCAIQSGNETITKRNNIGGIFEHDEANANKNAKTAKWLVYMEDTASLVTSPRLMGRAILEASDILKAAIKELKQNDYSSSVDENNATSTRNSVSNGKTNEKYDNETKVKQIRRLRKKLQFYLSWALHRPVAANFLLEGDPKKEIVAWIDERKQMITECEYDGDNNNNSNTNNINNSIDCFDGVIDTTITTLNFPASAGAAASTTSSIFERNSLQNMEQPLMVEVQSRHK